MANEEDKNDGENEAVEGEEGEGSEGEEDGKKSKKKLLIMILVPVILLIGGGAAAYFTGMLDSLLGAEAEVIECEEGDEECEHAKEAAEHAAAEEGDGDHGEKKADGHGEEGGGGASAGFLAIPTMIVNLNTEDGTPRFLRLTIQLELENPSEAADVEAIIPRVIDQFQTYLRELRVRDLRGSAGIYRLQMELLWRVNQASAPIEIKDVLFQEILIQ